MEKTDRIWNGKTVYMVEKSGQRRSCIENNCEECGEPFLARIDKLKKDKRKYCSNECSSRATLENQKGENNHNYKNGVRKWFYSQVKRIEKCEECGEDHPACLTYHHTDDDKFMPVSNMVSDGHSKKAILEEIEKCQVLCSNCHRKEHNNLYDEEGKYTGKY